MANTLTNLIPNVYAALDVVSRELVGFFPAVTRDPSVERAAVGQVVYSFVAPASTPVNIVPAVIPPDDGDQTIGSVPLQITKAMRVPFRWNGEQTRGVNYNGPGALNIQRDQVTQALRALTNQMETDIATAASIAASRAEGAAGTTPFATTLNDLAKTRKILDDNGAPLTDRHFIMDTTAGVNFRSLTQLTNYNQANSTDLLRQGELTALPIFGFALRESAQVQRPAIGTGALYVVNNGPGYAVGATSIVLGTGSGTVVPGDVVSFAGDTNQYMVTTGLAAPGTIVIANPGLRVALANATAMTIAAAGTRNVAFSRNALVFAGRLPALPDGGDLAIDRTTVVDPRTGFAFEIAMYPQYRQMQYEVSAAWGVAAIKPEHVALVWGQ